MLAFDGVSIPSVADNRNCWLALNKTKPWVVGKALCNAAGRIVVALRSIGSASVTVCADVW